ncbi:MAG: hypothetical protein RQ826_01780 [Xanthomonadales bacterium]|nr:hypothetical protein [Xanthomonadales bacterium]
MQSIFSSSTKRNFPGGRAAALLVAVSLCASVTADGGAFEANFESDNDMSKPWGYDSPAGRCVVCHSLEQGGPFRTAPNLHGIVGAEKARDREWYNYSPGLIRMGGTWTEEELDAFLADASAFSPGSKKSIRVTDAGERQEIIDFLKKLDD